MKPGIGRKEHGVPPLGKAALQAIAEMPETLPTKTMRFTIPGKPMAAPRMTKRDKWAKRPVVVRYFEWRNSLEPIRSQLPPAEQILVFSWRATFVPTKKKDVPRLAGKLHRAKPDRDNVDKALLDGLFAEDKGIAFGMIEKVWGEEAKIEIEIVYQGK